MSEDRAPYSPAVPMTPAVLLDSHEKPAAATPRDDAAIRAWADSVLTDLRDALLGKINLYTRTRLASIDYAACADAFVADLRKRLDLLLGEG